MPDTPHEVQPGLTDTQSGRPLQTNQPGLPPEDTSSPNASDTVEGVLRDELQERAHTAAPPAPGVGPNPPTEKIDENRWEEIIRNLEVEKLLEERKNVCTEEEKAKAWTDVADMVKTYSDDMIERWNKQIDTYLVFAGLFSAILTAFNVQSYPLLQQTIPDPTVVALQQISLQLQSFAISPPFVNSTHPAIAAPAIPPSTPSPVPRYTIWLNVLWFSGLILSLASTVIGILVKQWLGECNNGLTGNSREAARLRQYRLNNLVKWRVGDIIVIIPVLLLLSLALFLSGLLVLLWNLHPTVAVVASVLVGVLGVSTVCVTLLPVFKPSCAYISPQTLVLMPLFWHVIPPAAEAGFTFVIYLPILLSSVILDCFIQLCCLLLVPRWERWGFLVRFHDNIANFELNSVFRKVANPLLDFFPSDSTLTWRGYEQSIVNRLNNTLDIDILIKAYDSTLDANAVSSAAVCLLDQPSGAVVDYSSRLQSCALEHFGDSDWSVYLDGYPKSYFLAGQTLLCAANVMGSFKLPDETAYGLSRIISGLCTGFGAVPSPGLSPQTPAQNAWLRLIASSKTIGQVPSELSDGAIKFRSHCRQASQEPRDERVQDLFNDTRRSQSRDIDILRRETDRCLRLATTPRAIFHDAVVDNANDKYFYVHLDYLRAVDEYLSYAARVLGSTDSSGLEDLNAIRKNTCDILRNFKNAVSPYRWQFRNLKDIFKQDSIYRDHLRRQCNVLNTLNSQHEIFRSIGSFDGEGWTQIHDGLKMLNSWVMKEQTRAGRRDAEASLLSENLNAALARYRELYL